MAIDTQRMRHSGRGDRAVDDCAVEPPAPIVRDERRMQTRAYNAWAALLGERTIPNLADLDPAGFEFSPHAVLLDVSGGAANAAIRYLGDRLADESGATGAIQSLGDIPDGSLLSRLPGRFPRVLANRTPLGFEDECVNGRGATVAYRGILLPFSRNGESIEFLYGVINWKEVANQPTTEALRREMGGELDVPGHPVRREDRLTVWADGPAGGAVAGASAGRPREEAPCARRLRQLSPGPFAALGPTGGEFALLIARRLPTGEVVLLGEVPEDGDLLDRAARALLAASGG